MQKINFNDLPNTETPINSSNLNQLQTNVENAINGIIESGSNDNGSYVKFADGTLIQCLKIDKTKYLEPEDNYKEVQGIKIYKSAVASVQFPISFVDTNYKATMTAKCSYNANVSASRMYNTVAYSKSVSSMTTMITSLEPFKSTDGLYITLDYVDLIAVGSWK